MAPLDEPTFIPKAVVRRERKIVAGLLAACASIALAGYLTVPSQTDLLETARSAEDPNDRVRALNALIRRGFWKHRSFKEFELFMKGSPEELPQFMADMHGDMLKSDRRAWNR
ncbi:MAG: hypothetical protein AAGG01_04115 [Planctomycetota bacterium]